ncbi:MAG: von Willebrand factor type A domain-containing protein [Flavobacterium sp.]|uniref:YfbK domain-containing protein n=1 Tax=Flavobacterium sp. TaxID=239 RepID=UPI001B1AF12A|nr:von Willebrand factor type A domain-containing protein [Flavobacterium sp.]MBO9584200.1 von Willebrand factor type A domain-containing protein [Flavobacterium sp.]
MKSLKLISSAIAMLICFVTMAQERTISGIVTDESKQPLPGVNIFNQTSKANAATDFDGKYSIKAKTGDTLVFSFIGYKNQNQKVQNSNIINIKLLPYNQNLQEVVVVGYGSSDAEYSNRSYERAERAERRKAKMATASVAMQGKVSGIQVQNNVGYLASPSTAVVIRGNASVSPKNEPMYIVDGVPAKANQMAKINPNDIKDLKVLKDEAATSIYGSRAANGVVVIATKNELYKNLTEKELDKKLNILPIPTEPTQEDYDTFVENAFESPKTAPLSTFSIDVDNASYTNIRRFLNNGQEVPKDAVRVEEMVNFFKYTYPQPKNEHPFSINTEVSDSPWNANNKILKIGLQGKNIPTNDLPASNLVFLIDVSGSMSDMNKLPLLKQSLKILVNELRAKDKVAIVVYAGAAGLVLPPTSGDEKKTIVDALDKLQSGGSTAGGAGIELAYKIATENFIKSGNNRVILATDGDFNVGSSSNTDMEKLIEEKRKTGVFLTCLGYGMGNYKDSKMEILADKGNGNYAYIDNIQEANRFLGKEFKGSMFAIAKDVKIQIEFNPKQVQAYRLIGYENRKLRPEDFKNDAIDAGELGSNHTVTALYEIIPAGVKSDYLAEQPDELKYTKTETSSNNYSSELATIKFRYKKPDGEKSIEMVQVIENKSVALEKASDDMKFSSAVAWFGLKLRDSKLITNKSSEEIVKLAKQGNSNDGEGYKAEFIRLVETSKQYN